MTSAENFNEQVRESAERIADSGPAALAGLFDLTSQRLVRFATAITRNQHDAEDAVQGALVRVTMEPELLQAAQSPWPYLLRMVRNESLLIMRKSKRCSPLGSIIDLLTRRSVDHIEKEDTYRVIWQELRKLPTEQCEVVVLKIWEELTFAEIANILEIAPATAASRYRYGLAKLAKRLGQNEAEVLDV